MAYETFSSLNRILESAESKRRSDLEKSFATLQVAIGLKQYEDQQIRYEETKTLEASRHAEVLEHQIDVREHTQLMQRKAQEHQENVFTLESEIKRATLEKNAWDKTKAKLEAMDTMQLGSLQRISKGFHFGIGMPDVTEPETYKDMHDTLTSTRRGGLGMSEGDATRLLQSYLAAKAGDGAPTLELMRDIDVAVKTFNAIARGEASSSELKPYMASLVDKYGELGLLEPILRPDNTWTPGQIKMWLDQKGIDNSEVTKKADLLKLVPESDRIKFIDKWTTLFDHAEIVRGNRANIRKEAVQLLKDDDVEIQSKIELLEYERISESIKALEVAGQGQLLQDLADRLKLLQQSEKEGLTETEFKQVQVKDNVKTNIDQFNQADDDQSDAEYQKTILTRQNEMLGIDVTSALSELDIKIENAKAIKDSTSILAEQAIYKRDILAAVNQLESAGAPKNLVDFPEYGYSQDMIEKALDIMMEQLEQPRTGRRTPLRELLSRREPSKSKYVGIY